jgi:nucleoside phosphorylase
LQQWQFKQDKNAPCRVYLAQEICLFITQISQERAAKNLLALLHYMPPQKDDVFINFGICAAPSHYAIGETLLCTKLFYNDQCLTLEQPSQFTCKTEHLRTLDTATSSPYVSAIDMEAFALFTIALEHFSSTKCYCIKVVSDHFEPSTVNPKTIASLLNSGVVLIKEIIDENRHCHRS